MKTRNFNRNTSVNKAGFHSLAEQAKRRTVSERKIVEPGVFEKRAAEAGRSASLTKHPIKSSGRLPKTGLSGIIFAKIPVFTI